MRRTVPALAAVLLLAGLGRPGPPPKEPPASGLYLPTAVGTRWVYQPERGDPWTWTVTGVEWKDGAALVSVGAVVGGRARPGHVEAASARGITQLTAGEVPLDPPPELLRLPYRAGDEWAVTATIGAAKISGRAKAAGVERVKVPAGEFTALRVDVEFTLDGKPAGWTRTWYAAGVGMIQQEFRTGGDAKVIKLKEFTPGKD
jgi:hypothetical protein